MPNPQVPRHGRDHRPGGGDGLPARFQAVVVDQNTLLATGDAQGPPLFVSDDLDNLQLLAAHAGVSTASTSGTPTIQIRNATAGTDMLSTRITIDANETTSYTAATPPVVNETNATVTRGDRIVFDVDVAGTDTRGLNVILVFG